MLLLFRCLIVQIYLHSGFWSYALQILPFYQQVQQVLSLLVGGLDLGVFVWFCTPYSFGHIFWSNYPLVYNRSLLVFYFCRSSDECIVFSWLIGRTRCFSEQISSINFSTLWLASPSREKSYLSDTQLCCLENSGYALKSPRIMHLWFWVVL